MKHILQEHPRRAALLHFCRKKAGHIGGNMTASNENTLRTAFVSILGRPNVGKSSILNRLIGQKIAIVSKKPQTTRTRIMGILTRNSCQYVFTDTPGLIKPKNSLGEYMVKSVTGAIAGVDVCLLVVEAGREISKADEALIERFRESGAKAILAINKIDLLSNKALLMQQMDAYAGRYPFAAIVPISARDGDGMETLLQELEMFAQEGGFYFPEDTLTDQPERVIASEIVREKLLRLLDKEIPHGTATITENMKERGALMDVEVTIFCEKAGHKGIIIGKKGEMLKKIGIAAREDMERFFDCKINLQLWVKVKEGWRQRRDILNRMGYDERDIQA